MLQNIRLTMLDRNSVIDDIFGRPEKRCASCGRYLEHWQFNSSRHSKDGLQSYCKSCQRMYHMKNPDKQYKKLRNDKSLSIWE